MSTTFSRRDFAAAVLASGCSAAALAEEKTDAPPRPSPSPVADPAPADGAIDPAAVPQVQLEDVLLIALLHRYPLGELTEERALGLRAGLRRNLEQGELLRQVGLANSDEPATVFQALW